MINISEKKLKEILSFLVDNGESATLKVFNLTND